MPHKCPGCGQTTGEDWPISVGGQIVDGGCQECWEAQCSRAWWQRVQALGVLQER